MQADRVPATHHANAPALRERLARALHPLTRPPLAEPWNLVEVSDLLSPERALVPAAVLIGVVERAHGPTVILTLRTADLTHHAGQISFPGGRIEACDRDPAGAAVREALEEIGLAPGYVEPIGYLDRYVTITGFVVTPTVALVQAAASIAPDLREVAETFEVPLAYLLDPDRHELRSREFAGRLRHYHVIGFEQRDIWGATASIIVNLAERLGRS